jgi:hypothetical protein
MWVIVKFANNYTGAFDKLKPSSAQMRLPARLTPYSAKGTLIMRHDINQRGGTLVCLALAKGIYRIAVDAADWRKRKSMPLR